MKQEAILRGKLIGPLMPPTQTTQCEDDDALQAVRSNASQEGSSTANLFVDYIYECLVYVYLKSKYLIGSLK